MGTDTAAPWEERLAAFLAFKFGKRPSDSLLEYCVQWGQRAGVRHEAARLLRKRRARREADLLRAGIGVGGEGQGGESVD